MLSDTRNADMGIRPQPVNIWKHSIEILQSFAEAHNSGMASGHEHVQVENPTDPAF